MGAKTLETILGYEINPVAAEFPEMESADLAELAEDLKEHGQQQPVLTYQGKVIDGRNRLRACEAAGLEPIVRHWEPRAGESVTDAIVSLNLRRRHLTQSQRAALGAALLPHYQAEAKERQREAGGDKRSDEAIGSRPLAPSDTAHKDAEKERNAKAAEKAAKSTGASTRSVERAARVGKKAPKLAEKVKAGKVSLRKAEEKVREKAAIAKAPKKGERATSKIAANQQTWQPIVAAVRALAKAVHGSVISEDGTVSDEPYLEALVSDGRGIMRDPSVWAAQLGRCIKALQAVKPIAVRMYKGGKED